MEYSSGDKTQGQHAEEVRRQQTHLSFTASHQARHAARQGNAGAAGLDSENLTESAVIFMENFNKEIADISEVLATLVTGRAQTAAGSGISGARHAQAESNTNSMEDVGAAFDELIDRVKGLRQRTAEATLFLSAYNIRRAHEEAGKLLDSVEMTRAEIAPRKKFSFRSRKTGTGGAQVGRVGVTGKNAVVESRPPAVAEQEKDRDGLGLSGMTGKSVEVSAEDADKDKDFNVSDLNNCTVKILHVLGALRLRRLTSSRVICGPVRGPIYVEACKDCVIVAAGRQLRVHDSERVDFYVFVASGPIIEDCSALRFAPSGLRYPAHQEQMQEAGLSEVVNAWEDVKDFKWHRAQKSPNWNFIPEADRENDHRSVGSTPPTH